MIFLNKKKKSQKGKERTKKQPRSNKKTISYSKATMIYFICFLCRQVASHHQKLNVTKQNSNNRHGSREQRKSPETRS